MTPTTRQQDLLALAGRILIALLFVPAGFGKIAGLVLSLIILQVISSAFNLLNFSQFLTLAIWGTILVAVMAVPNIRKRLGLRD